MISGWFSPPSLPAAAPGEAARAAKQRGDLDPADFRVVGRDVEDRRHHLFENAPQAAGAGLVFEGELGDLLEDPG